MSFRYEIRLSGEGGQGLVLAGKVLAEAAAIYAGLNATQSQSYGPEARGGVSRSEVIISDDEIDYPKAIEVDLLLALTRESLMAYHHDLKPDGIVLIDESLASAPRPAGVRVEPVPFFRLAEENLGRRLFGNVVAVGVIAGFSDLLPDHAMRSAVESRAPKGTAEKNLEAFDLGLAVGRRLRAGE